MDSTRSSGGWADETALLGAIRSGDADALGAAYGRWGNLVYAAAFRILGSASDAEDLLQDVFIGLPRALKRYEEQGSFESWLKRVTIRAALMAQRSQTRRREDTMDALPPERARAASRDPSDELTIAAAIERLPFEMRAVFMLKEVEGYSHAEIAALLGITSGASAARLFRAWRMLRTSVGTS